MTALARIDPSLARGLHRGGKRAADERAAPYTPQLPGTRSRSSFLRAMQRAANTDPAAVVLRDELIGTGKRAVYAVLDAGLTVRDRWGIDLLIARARDFDLDDHKMRLWLTDHAVERRMQWSGLTDPRAAIRSMRRGLLVGVGLAEGILRRPEGDLIVAIPGGAMVITPHAEYAGVLTVVTVLRDADCWQGQPVPQAAHSITDEVAEQVWQRLVGRFGESLAR